LAFGKNKQTKKTTNKKPNHNPDTQKCCFKVTLSAEGHFHASLGCKRVNKLQFKMEVHLRKQRSPVDMSTYQKYTGLPERLWQMSAGDSIIALQLFLACEKVCLAEILWEACVRGCRKCCVKGGGEASLRRQGCVHLTRELGFCWIPKSGSQICHFR